MSHPTIQAELWILRHQERRLERDLAPENGLLPMTRVKFLAERQAVRHAIANLRQQLEPAPEVWTTLPMIDHVRTIEGEWLALEDAVALAAGCPCTGFIRCERLETYWSGRVLRTLDLPVTAVADAGHVERAAGRLRILVVRDPMEGNEPRARVVTWPVRRSGLALQAREIVFLPSDPVSVPSRA